ncbi:hypothetical protein BHE74_00033870 [Ensete ventricosum]|nr:hypothetical protein BHE74_00033870 [Ensete ventricosum]
MFLEALLCVKSNWFRTHPGVDTRSRATAGPTGWAAAWATPSEGEGVRRHPERQLPVPPAGRPCRGPPLVTRIATGVRRGRRLRVRHAGPPVPSNPSTDATVGRRLPPPPPYTPPTSPVSPCAPYVHGSIPTPLYKYPLAFPYSSPPTS